MTASRAAPSRAASLARTARGASIARNIAKRRDKPYKTELQTVKAKKKKLNLDNTFYDAPPGYLYLAVGTPDLAERCKELSRLRGCPVTIVHSRPTNQASARSDKVSGHIHRIGYHFREDVLREAARELDYVFDKYTRAYIKHTELQARVEQSAMARTLAKHGIAYNDTQGRESREQIQAAVRELFPKIPQADLEFVYDHAWEQGTDRIGNNTELSLSARVQLAVGSRIRHQYTDYDKLLKVFGDWQAVRAIVEPWCVEKLIEWRGELVDGEEFEELVRETIIIDDDDEDNERAVVEVDDDSADSDTSIEIVHKAAAAEDIGAESHDEHSRQFFQRHLPRSFGRLPPIRPKPQQHIDIRQKIEKAKSRRLQNTREQHVTPETRVEVVNVPPGQDYTMIGGELYRLARPSPDVRPSIEQVDGGLNGRDGLVMRHAPHQHHSEPYPVGRATPEGELSNKRRKMDSELVSVPAASTSNIYGHSIAESQPDRRHDPSWRTETIDPFGRTMHQQQQDPAYVDYLSLQGTHHVQSIHHSIESGGANGTAIPYRHEPYMPGAAVSRELNHDRYPGQPRERAHDFIIVNDAARYGSVLPPLIHGAPAPVQQVPRPVGHLPQAGTHTPMWYAENPLAPLAAHYQVHGAPAPVQQVARPGEYGLPPPPPPHRYQVHGAPAPVQQVPRPVPYQPAAVPPESGQPQLYTTVPPPLPPPQYQYQYQYPR